MGTPAKRRKDSKVFNDPIHGNMEFHPLLVKIIDTPEFQRLRYLKQLGCCYFVYPGASHNRFEHSLGVCFLAGKFARALQKNQPDLQITEKEILCLEIAGLCHDLGHGPFSHVFDNVFIPKLRRKYQNIPKIPHEELSVLMLKHLVDVHMDELRDEFEKAELRMNSNGECFEPELTFIRELIEPPKDRNFKYLPTKKHFLYEIVSNARNGIDVDKWDYFARDCHHLGMRTGFDHNRYMKFARVIRDKDNGQWQICVRDKEVKNLYDMFYSRHSLHSRAYQHHVTKIIEQMFVEAIVEAEPHLKFPGENGAELTISEILIKGDMKAYQYLTDDVINMILQIKNPTEKVKNAQNKIEKVFKRRLYKYIGEAKCPCRECTACKTCESTSEKNVKATDDITKKIIQRKDRNDQLEESDLEVQVVKMDYSRGDKNPVDDVRFYKKENPDEALKLTKKEVSQLLPQQFLERFIRVYCKAEDEDKIKQAQKCFDKWSRQPDCCLLYTDATPPGSSTPLRQVSATTPHQPPATPSKSSGGSGGSQMSSGVSRELNFEAEQTA